MHYIIQTVSAVLAAAMLLSCDAEPQIDKTSPETAPQSASPVEVTVATPEMVELSEPIFLTGTVVARRTTNITPLVGGLIEEIFVNVGTRVEKDQPLLRMRRKDFEVRVSGVSEARRLAQAEYEDAERDLKNAIALQEKQALSAELLDDRRTQVEVSSAKLGIANANLAEAQKEMDDSITRAPYRGVITQRHVDEGSYIPSIMRSERPVLQIQEIDVMVALVLVPEAHLNAIELGTPGKVHIPSMNKIYESEVALINDRIDVQTRTIDVRLGIPNADYAIKPGLFIEVELMPNPRQALVLPPETTTGSGSRRRVLVVEDGVVSQREVQVRELSDGRLEVIQGISPATVLIVGPGMHNVSPGSKVMIAERPYVAS
jgi:RND family efflux transporter MFP subunit